MQNTLAPSLDLTSCREVVLYGAGGNGARLCRTLQSRGIHVRHFLDQKAHGPVEGVPVLRPDAATVDDVPVVMSIFNPWVSTSEIHDYLTGLGYTRVVPFLALYMQLVADWGDDYWLTDPRLLTEHREDIARAEKLLADDASRQLFRNVVNFRQTADFQFEPVPDFKRQYFPSDVPEWTGADPLRLVDCGAYVGDTLSLIKSLGIPTAAAFAFEPDPDNFTALANFVREKFLSTGASVSLWPCGVADSTRLVSFDSGHGAASKMVEGAVSSNTIQCVALDEAVFGMSPNMIKMDVEGAEIAALRGARRTIEAFRPRLAISAYHTPTHLWEILFLISDWNLNYKFYLRSHGYQTFDTLLYAVP